MADQDRPSVSYVHDDELPFVDVKSQMQGDQKISVWLKMLDLSPERAFYHTRYDPGLVLQRHGHHSNHYVYVIRGDVWFDGEHCQAGSLIVLPLCATFGRFVVGESGAETIEVYFGDSRPIPADKREWAEIKRERGIAELPNPPLDVPEWFGERTD